DPGTRGVDEDAAVHVADVDASRARLGEERRDHRALARIAERAGEVVAGADREQTERRVGADQTVRDLVRGPVAADGDHARVAVVGRGAREPRGLAGTGR